MVVGKILAALFAMVAFATVPHEMEKPIRLLQIIFFLLLAFNLGTIPALASNKELTSTFLKNLQYYGDDAKIPYTSIEFCRTILGKAVPETIIKQGLAALNADTTIVDACLTEYNATWSTENSDSLRQSLPTKAQKFPAQIEEKTAPMTKSPDTLLDDLQYSHKKIVLNYYAQARGAGTKLSLDTFCASYQKSQELGKNYARTHSLARFSMDDGAIINTILSYVPIVKFHIKRAENKYIGLRAGGLSEAEADALWNYTLFDYYRINKALRSGKLNEEEKSFAAAASAALEKMPKYEGTVVRFTCLPPDAVKELQPGNIVNFKGFTSTSSNPDFEFSLTCQDTEDEKDLSHRKFAICTKNSGADISEISRYEKTEKEVLFAPDTRFKVLKNRSQKFIRLLTVLVPVDKDGKELGDLKACEKDIDYQWNKKN